MIVPAPWSLPTPLMGRMLTELKVQAALNVAAQTFNPAHVGEGDLSAAIRRQWIVQQRFYPAACPVYGRHQR